MSGGSRALLDTGVLVAFLHRADADHPSAVRAIEEFQGSLVTTEAVLTEGVYLLRGVSGGARRCLDFFIRGGAVLVPSSKASLLRSQQIMDRYADLPADLADATLVALAEEMDAWTVFTLDRRGFSVYRGSDGQSFEILP